MNSVNTVDNDFARRLSGVPLVIECGHCPGVELVWNGNPDHLPDLLFANLPKRGRIILSKKSVFLACAMCAKDLNAIVEEAGKTVTL